MRNLLLTILALALAGCQAGEKAGQGLADETLVVARDERNARPSGGAGLDATTTSSVAAPAVVRYEPPETGTVFTWRNNWSSLPPLISYRIDGLVEAGDRQYLRMTAVSGLNEQISAWYDTSGFALKGYRDESEKAIVTYKPVEERYRFPMRPGDKWVTSWRSFDHRKRSETSGGGIVQVVGFEMLDLPAGRFRAMKVRLPSAPGMPAGMIHHVWFAPELGVTVKEQIGNGSMNWTQILERIERP